MLLMLFVHPTFMGTLRWDDFCNFGATLLRFGTLLSNIILPWIQNFEKSRTAPTQKKTQKLEQKKHGFSSRWDNFPTL